MSESTVLTNLDDEGVFSITMNRPERRNAMNSEAFRAAAKAFEEANANPAVATVLLTGAGDDFSSGLDSLQIIGGEGSQQSLLEMMQTRQELDELLEYDSFQQDGSEPR